MADVQNAAGLNYTVAEVGVMENLDQHVSQGELKARGKLFLKDLLNLTGMEVSLNKLPAGKSVPFYHKHKNNEELYVIIRGKGQFQIDGDIIYVQEGTVLRVSPDGARTWRSSPDEDLYYIVIQAAVNTLQTSTISDGLRLEKVVEWPEQGSSIV